GLRPTSSSPFHSNWPSVGGYTPEMRLSSVVLPEPFGPNTPTMLPSSRPNEMSDTAVSPPKRLVRCRTSSSTPAPRSEAHDAARHQQDGENQDEAVDEQPRLGVDVDHVRQRSQHQRADDRCRDEFAAAKQGHRDDRERLVEREIIRIDVADVEGVQAAGDGGADVAGDKADELVAENVDPQRIGELVVQPDRREATAHP